MSAASSTHLRWVPNSFPSRSLLGMYNVSTCVEVASDAPSASSISPPYRSPLATIHATVAASTTALTITMTTNASPRRNVICDGRLFVEHFPSKDELIKNKPALIGIGIRQK